MDKIIENPQVWVSFLGLAYTIIIVPISIIAALYGVATSKKFNEMRKDYNNLRERSLKEMGRLNEVKAQCTEMIGKAKKVIQELESDAGLSKRRELVDGCLSCLKEKRPVRGDALGTIETAMLFLSEKGTGADLAKIIAIYTYALDSNQVELAKISYAVLKRMQGKL